MKASIPVFLFSMAAAAGLTAAAAENPDEQAIRQHITQYYFEGVRNSDTSALHKAFHPVAKMYFIRDGAFAERTIPEWLTAIAERAPKPARPDTAQRKVVSVDISGPAAMAKLQIRYADALVTDYMSLLKVNGEWVIVGKIFDRRPLVETSGK